MKTLISFQILNIDLHSVEGGSKATREYDEEGEEDPGSTGLTVSAVGEVWQREGASRRRLAGSPGLEYSPDSDRQPFEG